MDKIDYMMIKETKRHAPPSIAIIGMGCFFPKAPGLKQYWRLLFQGFDAITDVPDTHWSPNDYFDKNPKAADHVYCKRGGFLSSVDFDPVEFGIPPTSLEATDTSQLLGLVCAKTALSDAGYGEREFNRERTSVILGVTGTQELVIPLSSRLGHPIWRKAMQDSGVPSRQTEEIVQKISDAFVPWQENSFPGLLGNVVAGRIANRLDLGGTNCVVDAACASSLSALHLSLMELISNRSDMVVTGGVDTLNDIFMHMCFSKTGVLSPSGNARPFSSQADGTVLGEGIGLLVLKRLEDAEKDHDRIYAVIKGLGSSSDGKSQSIYAPRIEGQIRALQHAYRDADIDPKTVELFEAHGTGTRVGDKVEFEALRQVVGHSGNGSGRNCAIGSVKSMIGHTKAAAGVAGIIKSALSLYHKVLPPTLKADEPDPDLGIKESPFYLNSETRPWILRNGHPRRSGVSAFGFGGSNFHAILEEYQPEKKRVSWEGSVEIFAFSGTTRKTLQKRIGDAQKRIQDGKPVAWVAGRSRKEFSEKVSHRLLLRLDLSGTPNMDRKASDLFAKAEQLISETGTKQPAGTRDIFYSGGKKPERIAFIFPGQGSQYVGMGKDLVCLFPEALSVFEKADKAGNGKRHISEYVYPLPDYSGGTKDSRESDLRSTDIAQPAIGAVNLALLKVLARFGIKPDAVCGHSFGELTALCAAGWIDTDTVLKLAVHRGQYMALSGKDISGAMLAVSAPLAELESIANEISPDAVLSNRNSPTQGVLSGTTEAVAAAEEKCRRLGFRTKRLPVSTAFHTRYMESAKAPFEQLLKDIPMTPTDIPVLSNRTGTVYPKNVDQAKSILAEQLVNPVDFIANVKALYDMGVRTFVEVGPGSVLTGLVKSILSGAAVDAFSVDASTGKGFGLSDLAAVLCRLAALGYPVDLSSWEESISEPARQRMPIPLSGSNYRKQPADHVTENRGQREDPSITETVVSENSSKTDTFEAVESPKITQTAKNQKHREPMKRDPKNPHFIADALQVAKEGLKSMQAIQLQTAETHKKFLETQTEATRALQEMMRSTRDLTRTLAMDTLGSENRPSYLPETGTRPDSQAQRPVPLPVADSSDADLISKVIVSESASLPEHVDKPDPPRLSSGSTGGTIEQTLLEVVSRLTGYPAEMLEMEMDIESDLGIDSIKRVEILSTLEETLPGLPKISPDMMGTLKTLGQIADHLSDSSASAPHPPRAVEVEESAKDISESLLSVVSRLTGYPAEMLEMEMDIESDLGIDSIKRVEILSTLEETLPGLPKISPDMMGTLKTLGQIADYLSQKQNPLPSPTIATPVGAGSEEIINDDECGDAAERHVVMTEETPFRSGDAIRLPQGKTVYVTREASGLSESIIKQLKKKGLHAAGILTDAESGKERPKAAGLIILPGTDLSTAFGLARAFGPELLESGALSGAVFAGISRMDGAFGFSERGFKNPDQGGLAGLSKTADIEWPQVLCRAFDIDPDWEDIEAIAKTVIDELLYPDTRPQVEIGLCENMRYTLRLKPETCPDGTIRLKTGDLVVVTGGARGITADASLALARKNRPTLLLLGRSPQPVSEPDWLAGITDEADMKRAILSYEFAGATPTPLALEKAYAKYVANRDILSSLEKIERAGSTVIYRSVDIRDGSAVNDALAPIRSKHGPIRAIIHGAGILNDRWIVDKTAEQFKSVFDTKVDGLMNLLTATRDDPLKYLILFSSIAGRMGNKGQADYAMANEVINKTAWSEASARPECKVISINWGPWDGGMVSDGLKKEFIKSGIPLISVKSGTRAMLNEMKGKPGTPPEIVIGATSFGATEYSHGKPGTGAPQPADHSENSENFSLSFKREIDIDQYPILRSHVLDGKPVVPLALIAEWLGNGALHQHPGLIFRGFDNLRLLNGIRMDVAKRDIRLFAGKLKPRGDQFEVDVQLRDGTEQGREVIHSTAKAILSEALSSAPSFKKDAATKAYGRSVDEVYEQILFHGDKLRGIKTISSLTPNGMTARLLSAPSPSLWIKDPLRSRWVLDPLLLDAAFQMAIIWCYEERGNVSLPGFCASYRQYCESFPSDGVTAVMEVRSVTDRKMTGDFIFLHENETVLARLDGYDAIMDPALINAFKAG
jgi:acyl transferase domain-containing protein/NAD(P)-dependent dehydrogenase (short-subunit alcohol dehydrogenase family)/acyl carrier protein